MSDRFKILVIIIRLGKPSETQFCLAPMFTCWSLEQGLRYGGYCWVWRANFLAEPASVTQVLLAALFRLNNSNDS